MVMARVRELLTRYEDRGVSVAGLLCDEHPPEAVAYTVLDLRLRREVLTYGDLKKHSERFAAALAALGIGPGDRVATLMGKGVEQLVTLMGIWRLGAVQVPLFTAFAPREVELRLTAAAAKAVVCDAAQRAKLPADPPWPVIVVEEDFATLLAAHEPGFPAAALDGDAPFVHMHTSGTTGRPKGVVVPVRALASFHAYMELALGIRPGDVYWNAADPGWGYGLYYGIIGSFCTGVRSVWLKGGFAPELTWRVLSELRVTNLGAAPTVYRSLRAAGLTPPGDLAVRAASAAGEPLTPEINAWARETLGVPVHDHYGQTETGMTINNHHHPALRAPLLPGAMGRPMPGWSAAVLRADRDEPAPMGEPGRIAFDLYASPLAWFTGYAGDPAKSAEKFSPDGHWYLTGDTGVLGEDGYFRFTSREDDVIIMAGYRIGPVEVESVLLTHPDVVEAAAIATPDALRGEVLESYVVLRDGVTGGPALASELQRLVKTGYAAHAYPRAVHFVADLPKTASGKVQRHVLRERRRAEAERA